MNIKILKMINVILLLCKYSIIVSSDYASIYNSLPQSVNSGNFITLDTNAQLSGIIHVAGSADIFIETTGIYFVQFIAFNINSDQASVELYLNGSAIPTEKIIKNITSSTPVRTKYWEGVLSLVQGDILSLFAHDDSEFGCSVQGGMSVGIRIRQWF